MDITHKRELLIGWINDLDEPFIDSLIDEFIEGNNTFDFKLNQIHLSGCVSERNGIVSFIRKKSGEFFANGLDEIAHAYRTLANQLESDGNENLFKLNNLVKQKT